MAVAAPAVRRDRRLPAPPRHPRRRHARDPHAAHRARADRAGDDARQGRHPVRQGGRRAARPREDRHPQPAHAGRRLRCPRPDRTRHGTANRPRRPSARRPRGVPRHPGRRYGRHVPDREPRPDAGPPQGATRALRGPRRAGRDHPPRPGAGQRRPPVPQKEGGRGAGHLRASGPATHPRGHPRRDPLPGAGDAGRDRGMRLHRRRGRHLPQGDGLSPEPREDAGRASALHRWRHEHRPDRRSRPRSCSRNAAPSQSSASHAPMPRPSRRSPTTPPG